MADAPRWPHTAVSNGGVAFPLRFNFDSTGSEIINLAGATFRATGDNVYFGRAEYRLHVPRLFSIQPVPMQAPVIGTFRVAPDRPYGRPDWDFIIRGFFDAARVTTNKKQPGQTNDTLLSPGVGGELRFKDNLVFNVDWGYALNTIRNGLVKKGNDEVWFVITLIY